MGRVRTNIIVADRNCWCLFDTRARNTYFVKNIASLLPSIELDKPEPVALACLSRSRRRQGGWIYHVKRECHLSCLVEGFPVRTHAIVLEEIGTDEEGKMIEILLGALAMQGWGIRPIPDKEQLDMTNYPKEFVEFIG